MEQADAVLLIGTNPRYEAPLVNTRLRKAYVHNELQIASIGPKVDISYQHEHLGDDAGLIGRICNGSHAFSKVLEGAKKPAIIIGADMLERTDGAGILATVSAYCSKLNKPVSSVCLTWLFCEYRLVVNSASIDNLFLLAAGTSLKVLYKKTKNNSLCNVFKILPVLDSKKGNSLKVLNKKVPKITS